MAETAQASSSSASTSSSGKMESVTAVSAGNVEKFAEGERLLKEGDLGKAVDLFSRSLQENVEKHGELSPECVKYYLQYGKALLLNVIKSSNAFGTKLLGADMNDPEDHTQDEIMECLAANQEDLELAWEMFEVGRLIYSNTPSAKESQLGIAEIDYFEAKVLMENDNFAESLNMLKECLEIRKSHLPPHDQEIVETYLLMADACTYSNDTPGARTYYEAVADCISKQIVAKYVELTKKEVNGKSSAEETSVTEAKLSKIIEEDSTKKHKVNEIRQRMGVLEGVKEKINDMKVLQGDEEKVQSAYSSVGFESTGFSQSSSSSSSAVQVHTPVVKSSSSSSSSPGQSSKKGEEVIHSPPVKRKIVPQNSTTVPGSPEKKTKS